MAGPTEMTPLRGDDDLYEIFRGAEKPRSEFRIGAEAEKFGVDERTGAPLKYADPSGRSVQAILDALVERHGWTPEPEHPGGPIIALRRGDRSVTLEPGGQLELSGAPLADVHAICAEARGHLAEIRDISAELGITWLGVGFHPFAKQSDLDWVPKARYGIMQQYLPTRGANGLDMMRRTATVQANYDFSSERDAMRKLRVGLTFAPVVAAMTANSPFYEGKPWGGRSYRAKVWLDVANERAGLLPMMWKDDASYRDYVEWALDVPMFLFKRDGAVVPNTGQTFRAFLRDGFRGHRPTAADWEMHLNTLFPEVRLKRTLEVRSVDSLPANLACALPAIFAGLFYDDDALAEAEALARTLSFEDVSRARAEIPERALGATLAGAPLKELALRLLGIAEGGLARRARLSRAGKDERVHLERLRAMNERGECPADLLLAGLDSASDLPGELLRRARM